MLTIFAALVPVFLLIVLGFALRRLMLKQDAAWTGLEQLVYYVLFPALLIDSLARSDLASVPIAGVGGALMLSVLIMSALCLLLRPLLASRLGIDSRSFTSVFQGANRWQTFVALSVASAMWGNRGITLASVAMVAMIPLLNTFCVALLARYASPPQAGESGHPPRTPPRRPPRQAIRRRLRRPRRLPARRLRTAPPRSAIASESARQSASSCRPTARPATDSALIGSRWESESAR